MAKKTIIVIGGNSFGLKASAKARLFDENARIILIEQSPSFIQEKFWHYLEQDPILVEQKIEKELADFSKKFDVEILKNTFALSIDVDAHFVICKTGRKKESFRFDSLIFAETFQKSINPFDSTKVIFQESLEDLAKLQNAIKNGAKNAIVYGINQRGLKACESLKKAGLLVTMIDEKPMLDFSRPFLQKLLGLIKDYHFGEILNAIDDGSKVKVTLASKEISADFLVDCTEKTLNLSLLSQAQAVLDGFVQVDDQMKTTLPDIFACGPSVSIPLSITAERRANNVSASLKSAEVAGANAVGKTAVVAPTNDASILKVGETYFGRVGLSELKACQYFGADNVMTVSVNQDISIRLVINKISQAIIGAEIFGTGEVKSHINLLSLVITEGFTPEKLLELQSCDDFSEDSLMDVALRAHLTLNNQSQMITAEKLGLWVATGQEFSLINVDEVDEKKKGIHLPLQELRARLLELESTSPIVLYSNSGEPSFLAQLALAQRGLINSYHLDGDVEDWFLKKE